VDRLARRVDAMIVIGGLNSSNTTNLARIAREHLPRATYHVDSPEMVKPEFFEGIGTLGIGAGTSTPRSQIEAVKKRIAEIYPGDVVFEEDC
jgi:4-hydroxy-3-methylbut-2-enyl diphosphate reductase